MGVILLGVTVVIFCLFIQVLASVVVIRNVARFEPEGVLLGGLWGAVLVLGGTVLILLASFLVQIALWAVVFVLCGEFTDFETALYHSGVNYATLGYGDIVMSPGWRALGFLEAVNGTLMGGLAAALLFAVIGGLRQPLQKGRSADRH